MEPFDQGDHEWAVFMVFNARPSTSVKIASADNVEHVEKTGDGMLVSRYTRHGTRNSAARANS
jgi:hypothetical protein